MYNKRPTFSNPPHSVAKVNWSSYKRHLLFSFLGGKWILRFLKRTSTLSAIIKLTNCIKRFYELNNGQATSILQFILLLLELAAKMSLPLSYFFWNKVIFPSADSHNKILQPPSLTKTWLGALPRRREHESGRRNDLDRINPGGKRQTTSGKTRRAFVKQVKTVRGKWK